tara:strand:- start:666 stop:893 length:228 start_codon:yes stop_codon:yes gene_type:complete
MSKKVELARAGLGKAYEAAKKLFKPKVKKTIGNYKKAKINKIKKQAAATIATGTVAAAGAGAAGSYMASKAQNKK